MKSDEKQGFRIPAAKGTTGMSGLGCINCAQRLHSRLHVFPGLQVPPETGTRCKQPMVVEVALHFASGERPSFAHVSIQSKCQWIKLSSAWGLASTVGEIV